MTDDLTGDWYLFFGEGVPNPDTMARFTLRVGKVLDSVNGVEVGSYEVVQGLVSVVTGDGTFHGKRIDAGNPTLSGTFAIDGEDGFSDPALLLRVTEQPAGR